MGMLLFFILLGKLAYDTITCIWAQVEADLIHEAYKKMMEGDDNT